MYDDETPVLIVGGSMVGLSAALFLARQGVRPLLVERHPEISTHPRAQAASPRTMELLDGIGLGDQVRAAETPHARYGDILQVESLAGRELGRFDGPFRHDTHGASGTGWTLIGQHRLEPVLREHAERLGADIRFGTELVRWTGDDDGITAVLRAADGAERTVRAQFMIAADGHRSEIRQRLGIGTHGRGTFGRQMIIMFRADLERQLAGRTFFLCFVSNPDVHGVLGQMGAAGTDRWCLAVSLPPEDHHGDYTTARCTALVRAAVGEPDLPVVVDDISSWEIAARMADRMRAGRVFLAGDSAHVMPPTGGFGGNLGIQDAHNLAWKLGLVLRKVAGPALLDSYEAERLPVAEFTTEQGVIRYLQRSGLDPEMAARHRPEATVLFGHRYRSTAVLAEPEPDPAPGRDLSSDLGREPTPGAHALDAVVEDPREATGRPGTRAPYLPLRRGDRTVTVAELTHDNFALLSASPRWLAAGSEAAATAGMTLDRHLVGPAGPADLVDETDRFARGYGIGYDGAVLVRPDGFIAWRTDTLPADPAGVLTGVLASLLSRRTPEPHSMPLHGPGRVPGVPRME